MGNDRFVPIDFGSLKVGMQVFQKNYICKVEEIKSEFCIQVSLVKNPSIKTWHQLSELMQLNENYIYPDQSY